MPKIATGVASFAAVENGITAYLESEATTVYANQSGVVTNPGLYTNKIRLIQNGQDVLSQWTVTVSTQNVSGTYNSSTGVYSVTAVTTTTPLNYVRFDISKVGQPTITKYWTIVVVKESLTLNDITLGAQNLIRNSDFVDDYSYWESSVSRGRLLASDVGLPTRAMISTVPEGETVGQMLDLTQDVTFHKTLTSGDQYTFSFYCKKMTNDFKNLRIQIGPQSNLISGTVTVQAGSNGTWTRKSGVINVNQTLGSLVQPVRIFSESAPGEVYLTGFQLERGPILTDYKVSNQEVGDSVHELDRGIVSLQDQIDNGSIVNMVLADSGFAGLLSSKANADDYQEMLETLNYNNQYISQLPEGLGTTVSQLVSDMQTTKNAIDMKFKMTAGINLIRNSTGFFETDYWEVSGDFLPAADTTIEEKTVGSAFRSTLGGSATQTVAVMPGKDYSLSFWFKKGANKDLYIDLIDPKTGNHYEVRGPVEAAATDFSLAIGNFKTGDSQTELKIVVNMPTGGDSYVSGLMLNEGDVALQWSSHSQEIANRMIKFNLNGIKVLSNSNDGSYTQITPSEFAGYAMTVNDNGVRELARIFTLNGDTTEVHKLKSRTSVEIGDAAFLYINNASYQGLALFL